MSSPEYRTYFFTRSDIIVLQSSLLFVYSAICSVLLAMLIAGTILDIVFIQMPKWRSQDIMSFNATNGFVGQDEHQPLLYHQPAKAYVPEPGRLKVHLTVLKYQSFDDRYNTL